MTCSYPLSPTGERVRVRGRGCGNTCTFVTPTVYPIHLRLSVHRATLPSG